MTLKVYAVYIYGHHNVQYTYTPIYNTQYVCTLPALGFPNPKKFLNFQHIIVIPNHFVSHSCLYYKTFYNIQTFVTAGVAEKYEYRCFFKTRNSCRIFFRLRETQVVPEKYYQNFPQLTPNQWEWMHGGLNWCNVLSILWWFCERNIVNLQSHSIECMGRVALSPITGVYASVKSDVLFPANALLSQKLNSREECCVHVYCSPCFFLISIIFKKKFYYILGKGTVEIK